MDHCPKCGHPTPGGALECPRCGVVFAKVRRAAEVAAVDATAAAITVPAERTDPVAAVEWWGRVALLGALSWWTWSFAATPLGPGLIRSVWHLPDLVFHEAGHVLFMPFGALMTSLGGSVFQCALPLALAGAFLRQDNRFAAAVCVWWAGQNLVDVAPYIADARSLRLVLIGGRTGAEVEGHDWEFILTELGWLHLDRPLGVWTYRAGMATMIAAVVTLLWTVRLRPPHRPHTAA